MNDFVKKLNDNAVSRNDYLSKKQQQDACEQKIIDDQKMANEEKDRREFRSKIDKKYNDLIELIKSNSIEAVKKGLYVVKDGKKTIYGCIRQVYCRSEGWYNTEDNLVLENRILVYEKKNLLGKTILKLEKTGDNVITNSVYLDDINVFVKGVRYKKKDGGKTVNCYRIYNQAEEYYLQQYITTAIPNMVFITDFYDGGCNHVSSQYSGMGDWYEYRRCDYKIHF